MPTALIANRSYADRLSGQSVRAFDAISMCVVRFTYTEIYYHKSSIRRHLAHTCQSLESNKFWATPTITQWVLCMNVCMHTLRLTHYCSYADYCMHITVIMQSVVLWCFRREVLSASCCWGCLVLLCQTRRRTAGVRPLECMHFSVLVHSTVVMHFTVLCMHFSTRGHPPYRWLVQ